MSRMQAEPDWDAVYSKVAGDAAPDPDWDAVYANVTTQQQPMGPGHGEPGDLVPDAGNMAPVAGGLSAPDPFGFGDLSRYGPGAPSVGGGPIGGYAPPPEVFDLGNGQYAAYDADGNPISQQTIRQPPEPTFTENLGRGFVHAAARGLPAGVDALPLVGPALGAFREGEALRSPGDGVGGFVGGALGGLTGIADPRNAAGNYLAMGAGSAVKAAAMPALERIAQVAGPRVASILASAVENGTTTGGMGMVEHAQQEDWANDPAGALGRTLMAGGVAAAGGGVGGAAFGAAGKLERGARPEPAPDPRLIQQAVNEMRPGALPEVSEPPPTLPYGTKSDQSPTPTREVLTPADQPAPQSRTLDLPLRPAEQTRSIPSDRPSLEALAAELGVEVTPGMTNRALRRAVETRISASQTRAASPVEPATSESLASPESEPRTVVPQRSESSPPGASPRSSELAPTSPLGPHAENSPPTRGQTPESTRASGRSIPSLTPSPAEASTSADAPMSPRTQAVAGEALVDASRTPSPSTPIESASQASSTEKGPSPNPTPRERQAWEMTREEMGGWDVRTNEPVALSPTVTVPLSELKQLPGYRRSAEAVQQRAEGFKAGTLKEDPLTVIPDRDGGYFIDNGNHRFQLLQDRGATSAQVRIKLGPDDSFAMRKDPTLGHRRLVEKALREGKPVPPEVLKDYPSLTPSPAEVEASQTTQSRLSQDPRYPRAQAGSDIRGIESTGESGIPLAREQESGPREAPTPIRTGDTDRTTQTTSSRDSGIDSSPNPTPRERQAWEMTREEIAKAGFIAYDANGNAFVNTRGGGRGDSPQLHANHEEVVAKALREGRTVPPEVLADYPDLKPATPKVADATPDVATPAPATPPPVESRSAGAPVSKGDAAQAMIDRSGSIRERLQKEIDSRDTPAMWLDHQLITPNGKYEYKGNRLVRVQDLSETGFRKNLMEASGIEADYVGINKHARAIADKISRDHEVIQKQREEDSRRQRERDEEVRMQESVRREAVDAAYEGAKFKAGSMKNSSPDPAMNGQEIKGQAYGGLLVHKADSGWIVSHIASGKIIMRELPTRETAKKTAVRMTELADWTASEKALVKQGDKMVSKLRQLRTDLYADIGTDAKIVRPTPDTTTPTPEASPGGKPSLADRLEASARDKIRAIDADVAKKRRSLKKGQRLGVAPIFDYLVPYAQIALAKSIRAVNTTGEKVKVLRKYVREALKDSGIVDRKYENRVLTIARAMVKDATDPDGSLSQDRLYEVMDEAQQTFQRPTKGAETKRVIAENTQPQKQDKTITERQALRERFKAQRAAAPEIFKAGEVAGADKQEVKGRSQTIRAMLKMRRMGKAEGIAEGKARAEKTLDKILTKQGTIDSLQKEAAGAVKRMIPRNQRGDWYSKIKATDTPEKLAAVLNGVKTVRARMEGRNSAQWIRSNASPSELARTLGTGTKEIMAARSQIDAVPRLLRELESKDMDTAMIAADELGAIESDVRALMHSAKESNSIKLAGRKVAKKEAQKAVADAIVAAHKPIPDVGSVSGNKESALPIRLLRKSFTPDVLARYLEDGFKRDDGPVTAQMRELHKGMERKYTMRREYQAGINAIVSKYGYRDIGEALGKISGTMGRRSQETINVTVGGRKLTKGQALYIAIMDPKAKAQAAGGGTFVWSNAKDVTPFQIDNATRQRIYDALPAKDLAMAGEIKKLYNDLHFDALDKVSLSLRGQHLVREPDYMPIHRHMPQKEGGAEPQSMRNILRRHLEDAGFLKRREGGNAPIVVHDAMLELLSMGEAASNVAALAEPARFAEMVLLEGDVRTKIRDAIGGSGLRRMERIIYGLADQPTQMDSTTKLTREIMSNLSASKTVLSRRTWLKQIGGIFPLWTEMDAKHWAKGIGGLFSRGAQRDMESRSGFFWNRWNGGPYSAYMGLHAIPDGQGVPGSAFTDASKATLRQLLAAGNEARKLQFREAAADVGGTYKAFKQVRGAITIGNFFDSIPARVAYTGFISKAKELHPDWTLDRQKNWAADRAAEAFRRTQNTADHLNASGWQQDAAASNNMLLSAGLMFSSQPAKMSNLLYSSWKTSVSAGSKATAAIIAGAALSATVVGVDALGVKALAKAFRGERITKEEADDALDYATRSMAMDIVSVVPGASSFAEMVSAVKGRGQPASVLDSPMSDLADRFAKGTADLSDAIERAAADKVKNRKMLTAREKFLRAMDAIQSATRSALGDPTVSLTDDISRAVRGSASHKP